jgi:hypothetical protein
MGTTGRRRAIRAALGAATVAGAAAVVLLLSGNALAVRCGLKQAPPDSYGVSYGSINVPSAPNTYHVYYSFWQAYIAYYARRIRPDGTYAYEHLYSSGGTHDFTNSIDVDRRTQMKDNDGLSGWGYWVQANSMTYC